MAYDCRYSAIRTPDGVLLAGLARPGGHPFVAHWVDPV